MLTTLRYNDPAVFRNDTQAYLLRDEPRHNLILGLLHTLIEQPDLYTTFGLWRVHDADGTTVGAALQTPPYVVAIAAPASDAALASLAQELASGDETIPGVIGGLPEAQEFASLHAKHRGLSIQGGMEQGIYVLETVNELRPTPGAARAAGPDDFDLVRNFWKAFHDEVSADDPWDEEQVRRRLTNRLAGHSGERVWLWEDDRPVALAGCAGETQTGIRIGPVYTPPELRGRGYATGLVAHASQELLDSGRAFCFLYTDMSNPTSNAIYRRIGYHLHCGSAMLRFE